MCLHPLYHHVQRHLILSALGNNNVGVALGRLHKLLVHGLDRGEILGYNAVQTAAPVPHVPGDAPEYAHIGVGVHIDLDVHLPAQLYGLEY